MSGSLIMCAEFDRIADVYDETRPMLLEAELGIIADTLKLRGCHSILEIGVGTGRVSKPLSKASFDMFGVDLSARMIGKAKEKGLDNLVISDASALPFIDDAFDAAILVHVIHLLPNPAIAFAEIARTVRRNIVAVVRRPPGAPDDYEQVRRAIRSRLKGNLSHVENPWKKEAELLQSLPPLERKPFCDRTTEMTIDEVISILKKRAYRFTFNLTENDLNAIADEITSLMKGRTIRRRRCEDIAVWRVDRVKAVG